MSSVQTLDALLNMTPDVNGQDLVRLAARHVFLGQVKSQQAVREVFFSGHTTVGTGADVIEDLAVTWFDFSQYSVLFACQAICKLKDTYQIYKLLDEELVDEKLLTLHNSSEWKKIGFSLYIALFPDLVKDESSKLPFRKYLEKDPRGWAKKLCERVHDKNWISQYLPLCGADVGRSRDTRELNLLFVKLHLLDPTAVVPTFNYLAKAVPDLSLELATTNYLGGPLEWTLIRTEVETAIQAPSYATNIARITLDDVELYRGIRVCEFIMMEARQLGLWTGSYPDNKRISHFRDRCAIM